MSAAQSKDTAPLAGRAGLNPSNTSQDHSARQSEIMTMAIDYAHRGWSVIPMLANKKPRGTWKSAQTIAATADKLSGLLQRSKNFGIGIVLGTVSGGLYVRDFDDVDAYALWSAAHPDLAATMPTVRTLHGFHVYGRWNGTRIIPMPDGELRGEGAYVVAPPTPTANGGKYEWIVPLPARELGELPETDPTAAGLAQTWTSGARATERTERTEETDDTEDTEDTEDTDATEGTEAISGSWSVETRAFIDDAVDRTMPPKYGLRNLYIFRLVRALKAIPELALIPPAKVVLLKPILKYWYQRALPTMQTKDFGSTWGDFANAWANVKFAEGDDIFGAALQRAEESVSPAWSADYEPKQRLLASLCRELQRIRGDAPFFLSCAKAADCLGVDPGTANRWLAAFVADQALVCVEKGSQKTRKATRWRYVANDLK